MAEIVKPGQGILYMKVGTHAQESLEDIIERKTKEIEAAGLAFWGYGGNTCHPQTMVQPFARDFERQGGVIYLCMQPMESKHFAEQIRADEFSVDGSTWSLVPDGINVLGSRYALAIKKLHRVDFELPLDKTRVAVGNSVGAIGSNYIAGRVDKACLQIVDSSGVTGPPPAPVHIGLVAEVVEPYAVYLRNRPR
jgi:hypothetical protein